MRVVKFGGSSVADATRLRHVASIIAELRAQGQVAVVVSAMAGVTDALLDAGRSAVAGDSRVPELLEAVALRHYEAWAALGVAAPHEFERLWATLTQEAHTLARRSAGLSALARARLVAQFSGWGERLIVGLLAQALREAGLTAEAFDDAPVALYADSDADREGAEPEPSTLATRARLLPRLALLVMRGGVPVLPGYIARDTAGALSTLGRNGSDHSAAVIAAALGAERLTIYSDVPGMLTADPRIAPDAVLLPTLTYDEAQRMAMLGARALHPRTIEPVARWGIPLALRATLAPHAPGTDIVPAAEAAGRSRAGAWFVASRPLAGSGEERIEERIEVTAVWLPAWPADASPAPCSDTKLALSRRDLLRLGAHDMTRTADSLRLVVDTARAAAAVRVLHAALRNCPARHERVPIVSALMA
jgi:aspartate kinase